MFKDLLFHPCVHKPVSQTRMPCCVVHLFAFLLRVCVCACVFFRSGFRNSVPHLHKKKTMKIFKINSDAITTICGFLQSNTNQLLFAFSLFRLLRIYISCPLYHSHYLHFVKIQFFNFFNAICLGKVFKPFSWHTYQAGWEYICGVKPTTSEPKLKTSLFLICRSGRVSCLLFYFCSFSKQSTRLFGGIYGNVFPLFNFS